MKINITPETLDQYIYDNGYEAAKEYFKISDKKIETILFKNPINQIKKESIDKRYLEDDEITTYSPISHEKRTEIETQYLQLLNKLKNRLKNEEGKIDGNGYELIDRIHQQFLKMMLKDITIDKEYNLHKSIRNIEGMNNRRGYIKEKNRLSVINEKDDMYSINEYENTIIDEYILMLKEKFEGSAI
ncbi:hypothetical protein E9993_01680 [Labilibacter sediminis]|nr:hypothetical protein E9993_01680 [Labilibacter sediminis]